VPRADGKGGRRREILVVTPAISALIREGKTHQIYSAIQPALRSACVQWRSLWPSFTSRIGYAEDALSKATIPRAPAARKRSAALHTSMIPLIWSLMNSEELKQIAVLEGVDEGGRNRLAAVLEQKDYTKADHFRRGRPGDSMYFILKVVSGSRNVHRPTCGSENFGRPRKR